MKCVRQCGRAVGTLLLALLAALSITTAVGVVRVTPVLSGSMRGAFNPGDALLMERVSATSLHVGDVVAVNVPARSGDSARQRVHRIVSLHRDGSTVFVRTKGDANSLADPGEFKLRGRQYVQRARLPYVGWIVDLKSANGMRLLLEAIALAVLVSVGQQIWLRRQLVRRPGLSYAHS
jgi:signal peptidase I